MSFGDRRNQSFLTHTTDSNGDPIQIRKLNYDNVFHSIYTSESELKQFKYHETNEIRQTSTIYK